MMPIIQLYVDDDTLALLREIARRDSQGRTVTQLAEAAVEDAAIRALPPQARGETRKEPRE